jgi:hypothetical protein
LRGLKLIWLLSWMSCTPVSDNAGASELCPPADPSCAAAAGSGGSAADSSGGAAAATSTGASGSPSSSGDAANGGIGSNGSGNARGSADANGTSGMSGPMSGPAVCGNGMIELGEKCDPAATCPTLEQCRTNDKCLVPMLRGDPTMCNVACDLVMISECTPGDGCCPTACNAATDSDCSASCGDAVIGAGETCEPGSPTMPCPATCDDKNPCTEDRTTGTPAQCNVVCTNTPITQPAAGDICCPPGADATNDADCKAICGNQIVEPGEKCDGDCAASCDDDDPCTVDTMQGNAQQCSVICTHTPITAAAPGDGCCPPGANAENDGDCNAKCGNGVKEGSEKCDGADCPRSCDDGDDCTMDMLMGSASACTAVCAHTAITNPAGGDGCCPPRANANNDNDCQPKCGNGVKEDGETCDGASCQMNCDDGKKCTSDRQTGNAASCNVACTNTAIVPCCGDGRTDFPETCDGASCGGITCPDNQKCKAPRRTGSAASCDLACTYVDKPCCGNGIRESGETCDGASCNSITCADKTCMTGSRTGSPETCDVACVYEKQTPCCGNGTTEAGESCDGNCPSEMTRLAQNGYCEDGNPCTQDLLKYGKDKCTLECGEHARQGSGQPNICGGCNSGVIINQTCAPNSRPECATGGITVCDGMEATTCKPVTEGC